MKNTSNLDLKAVRASDSADWVEAFSVRSREHVHERAALRAEGVDPRIFSHVYSHIFNHRGSDDSRALVELISAICLERTAFYFEALEPLEWPARDLGLELIKAKLHGAFSPEAWEEARWLASKLNRPSSTEGANANATGREAIHERQLNPQGAQDSPIGETPENRSKGNSGRAMRPGSADFEKRPGEESLAREGRPFWRNARTALLYGSQRAGLDNFKYLWGAAPAAAVIGFCALLVVLDEVERRSFAPLHSEKLPLSSQVQDPVPLALETTAEDGPAPQEGPSPETARVRVAEAGGVAREEASKAESVIPSEESPAPEGEGQVTEQAAAENEMVPAPPLVSVTESAVPADSSPPQEALATAPSVESPAQEARPTTTSKPPEPVQKKVTSGRGSKTANPSLVKRSAPRKAIPPPNPKIVEMRESVNHQVQVETPGTPAVEQPPAVSEPSDSLATQNPAPAETKGALVEKPDSNPSVPQQIIANNEPAPEVKAPKKRESLLEDWLGFNPREMIAKIQPGRRVNQPDFIRQLEGVEGTAEN